MADFDSLEKYKMYYLDLLNKKLIGYYNLMRSTSCHSDIKEIEARIVEIRKEIEGIS